MVEGIDPINLKLAQILGDEEIRPSAAGKVAPPAEFPTNPFEDILSKAVDALEGVSRQEFHTNQLINKYVQGEADLQDVMVESSKASIMVQLAVTTVTSAVNTFKEITQMQI